MVGPLSSYRTSEATVPTDAALHHLETAFGFRTDFFPPLTESDSGIVYNGITAKTRWIGAVFAETENVRVLARYTGGVNDGLPAVISLPWGNGTLILNGAPVSGEEGDRLLSALYGDAMELAGVLPEYRATPGTVCYVRESANERYLFCVNMDGKGGRVETPEGWKCICAHGASGMLELEPFGYAVLMEE